MSNMILTTSGFLLPENRYYTPYAQDADPLEMLGNLKSFSYANDALTDYFKANDVHNASTSDTLYDTYRRYPTFENYMAIVDYICEIMGNVSFSDFVEAQIKNPHIAPVSLTACKDLVTGKFNEFQAYHRLSSSMRFTMSGGLTAGKASQLSDAFVKDVRSALNESGLGYTMDPALSWVNVLSNLMTRKNDLVAFFRYVFVHSY